MQQLQATIDEYCNHIGVKAVLVPVNSSTTAISNCLPAILFSAKERKLLFDAVVAKSIGLIPVEGFNVDTCQLPMSFMPITLSDNDLFQFDCYYSAIFVGLTSNYAISLIYWSPLLRYI